MLEDETHTLRDRGGNGSVLRARTRKLFYSIPSSALRQSRPVLPFCLTDAVPSHPPRRLCRRKTPDGDGAGLQDTAEEEDGVVGVRGAAGRREVRRRPAHVARRRRVDEDGVVAIDELGTGPSASQAPPRPSSTPVPPYAPPPLAVSPGAILRRLFQSCLSARRHPTLPRLEAPHAGAASAPGAASCPCVALPPSPRATPLDASATTSSLLPASVLSRERERRNEMNRGNLRQREEEIKERREEKKKEREIERKERKKRKKGK
jgi:hypothetical protein